MSQPNRRDLEPLQTNDTATILVGTALWAIALIVLLIAQPAPAHRWWIWTCVAGIAGGVFGIVYVRRSERARARAQAEPTAQAEPEVQPQAEPRAETAGKVKAEIEAEGRAEADAGTAGRRRRAEEPAPPRRTGGAH